MRLKGKGPHSSVIVLIRRYTREQSSLSLPPSLSLIFFPSPQSSFSFSLSSFPPFSPLSFLPPHLYIHLYRSLSPQMFRTKSCEDKVAI